MRTGYVMESAAEAHRLEAKTQKDVTLQHLELVGLRPGMRALDAGAGTGAVARTMAQVVGPTGSVVALDQSEERMAFGRAHPEARALPNLEFRAGSLYDPPLQERSFDFIWCRFVFEYLADPDLALRQLSKLLKPGGKIVIGDLDGNITLHHPAPPIVEDGLAKLMKALEGNFDPNAGRKLFHRFCTAGLRDIRVHCLPYHFYAGAIPANELPNWEQKFVTVRPTGVRALGGEAEYDAFVEAYLRMLQDPQSLTYSILFLVEGLR